MIITLNFVFHYNETKFKFFNKIFCKIYVFVQFSFLYNYLVLVFFTKINFKLKAHEKYYKKLNLNKFLLYFNKLYKIL